jgi:hypothetical protein
MQICKSFADFLVCLTFFFVLYMQSSESNCCKIQLLPMMKQTVFAQCMTVRDYSQHYCLPSEAFNLFML